MEKLRQLQCKLNDALALPDTNSDKDKKVRECTENLNKAFLEYQSQIFI